MKFHGVPFQKTIEKPMDLPCKTGLAACPLCITEYRDGTLHRFAVSLTASVIMCSNDQCCYLDDGTPGTSNPTLFSPIEDEDFTSSLLDVSALGGNSAAATEVNTRTTTLPPLIQNTSRLLEDTYSNDNVDQMLPIKERTEPSDDDSYPFIMLWPNVDALCWLDVVLCMLCHNTRVRQEIDQQESTTKKLVTAFRDAQQLLSGLQPHQARLLRSVLDQERVAIKLGGGEIMLDNLLSAHNPLKDKEMDKARRKLRLATIKLECAREEMWQLIESRLRCRRGKNDSPVFGFQALAYEDKHLGRLYSTRYTWRMDCSHCGYVETSDHESFIPTMPRKPDPAFSMSDNIFYVRDCFKCKTSDQKRYLNFRTYPHCLAVHFADGLTTSDISQLSFSVPGQTSQLEYRAMAVVEYQTAPGHFTVWQRDLENPNLWMHYDDLQAQYTTFNKTFCLLKPQDVHIVFWECINIDNIHPETAEKSHSIDAKINSSRKSPKSKVLNQTFQLNVSKAHTSAATENPTTHPSVISPARLPPAHAPGTIIDLTSPINFIAELDVVPLKQEKTQSSLSRKPRKKLNLSTVGSKQRPPAQQISTSLSNCSVESVQSPLEPPRSNMSYSQIISQLSGGSSNATQLTVSTKTTNNIATNSKARSEKQPAKTSYLDLVTPLLEKNKKKKSADEGYIPLSKRPAPQTLPADRKRVMFSNEAKPSSPVSSGPTTGPLSSTIGVRRIPPRPKRPPPCKFPTNRVQLYGAEFQPPKRPRHARVKEETLSKDTLDMPDSLEDLLSGI